MRKKKKQNIGRKRRMETQCILSVYEKIEICRMSARWEIWHCLKRRENPTLVFALYHLPATLRKIRLNLTFFTKAFIRKKSIESTMKVENFVCVELRTCGKIIAWLEAIAAVILLITVGLIFACKSELVKKKTRLKQALFHWPQF